MKVIAGSWLIASVCIGADEAQFVDDAARVRKQLAEPGAGLAMLSELEPWGDDREARLARADAERRRS